MNTFEKQASEYIGVEKVSGTVTITSPSGVTTFADPSVGATGNYIKMGLGSDASYIDFGSENAGGTGEFDSRIVSFKNSPFTANNFAFITDGNIQLLGPTQVGSPFAPPFKLDYGVRTITPGVNQVTTITYTPGIFTTAPMVTFSVADVGGTQTQFTPYVTLQSATQCQITGFGTVNGAHQYQYIALGN